MSNDDSNISRKPHNIYWAAWWQTRSLSPELSTFSWLSSAEWESLISVTAPCLCRALQISQICESRVASLSRKIFSPSSVCGGVSRCRDSPGENKARLRHGKKWAEMRGSGAAIFWILETEMIMRLRSVWECVSPHRSGQCRGWRQHHGSPSDITAHTLLTPVFAPGAYYFVLSSSSLPSLSHRPASSVERGVTGPREPVSKQYQENKSEDQL